MSQDADFQTLRHLINKGALGDIKEAEFHYDFESPPWLSKIGAKYTPGSGMAFGLGTHSIDQALVLFGRPKSVTGFFRVQRDAESEVEDSFTIILQYDGVQKDLLVTVKTAVTTPMAQQLKQLVRGTKGSLIKVRIHLKIGDVRLTFFSSKNIAFVQQRTASLLVSSRLMKALVLSPMDCGVFSRLTKSLTERFRSMTLRPRSIRVDIQVLQVDGWDYMRTSLMRLMARQNWK